MLRIILCVVALAMSSATATAVEPDEVLSDPSLEHRARDLSAGLRCLVCQNQSIDDSAAPLARDLRLLIRERLEAGDSDSQVREFVVARYGDFVLLRPPFETRTVILWLAPFLVVMAGALTLFLVRRAPSPAEAALSEEERQKLNSLLDQ